MRNADRQARRTPSSAEYEPKSVGANLVFAQQGDVKHRPYETVLPVAADEGVRLASTVEDYYQ